MTIAEIHLLQKFTAKRSKDLVLFATGGKAKGDGRKETSYYSGVISTSKIHHSKFKVQLRLSPTLTIHDFLEHYNWKINGGLSSSQLEVDWPAFLLVIHHIIKNCMFNLLFGWLYPHTLAHSDEKKQWIMQCLGFLLNSDHVIVRIDTSLFSHSRNYVKLISEPVVSIIKRGVNYTTEISSL